jgi:hypothetical protein
MPINTVVSRLKTDFFVILVPGSYVFSIILFFYLAISHEDMKISLSQRIEDFFRELKEYWALTLIIIIICYLLGILIRSFRVTIADELSKKLFSWLFKKGKWNKKLYESSFPYPAMLEVLIDHLEKQGIVLKSFKLPPKDTLYSAYQFWKISICSELPDVFSYTQNMESTVRLFAGMFWAGLLGIIGSCSLLGTWLLKSSLGGPDWVRLGLIVLGISLIISFIFGMNIRRVRGQEVRYVFYAYLVLQEKKQKKKRGGS